MRNLYDILGIARDADTAEIRKAYRALAKKYHPDRNPDPSSTQKFREITQAYEVLGTPERRVLYDKHGDIALNPNFKGFEGESWNESSFSGFEDFFNGFSSGFDSHGTQAYRGSAEEEDSFFQHTSTSQNEYGTQDSFYTDNFGFGGDRQKSRNTQSSQQSSYQPPQRGTDIQMTLSLELTEAIMGCTKRIDVRRPTRWTSGSNAGMSQETVVLTIPVGTQSGVQLRSVEKGNPGTGGGISGDLIVNIQVSAHPYLYREGCDVFLNIPLTLSEGVLGTQLAVPTLHGTVRVRIPPNVQSGQKLRLRDRGGPSPKGGHGDMYLILRVTPPDLSHPDVKELAKSFDEFYPVEGLRHQMKL